jgi:hypothetical protein
VTGLHDKWRRAGQLGWASVAGLPAHRLRWRLSDSAGIERWTDERLAFGGGYWLFVLGVNNSGTTVLGQILSTHPEIRSLPREGQFLTRALPAPLRLGVPRIWTERLDALRWTEDNDPEPARRAQFDWACFAEPGPGIVLEKSPPNTVRSRWLQANFRPCRFLALVRHPAAVSEGIRRRTGCTIRAAARHWVRGNEILLEDIPSLDDCLLLTYEELTDRPDALLDSLQEFLGLHAPFDRRVLQEPIRSHSILDEPQPLQNMNARSLELLSEDDLKTIDRIAEPLMEQLGYQPERSATVEYLVTR